MPATLPLSRTAPCSPAHKKISASFSSRRRLSPLLRRRDGTERCPGLRQGDLGARQNACQHAGLGPLGRARRTHVQGADSVRQAQQRGTVARGYRVRWVHDPCADGDLGDRHRAMEDRPGLDQGVDRWRDLVLQPVHIDRGVQHQHQRQIGRQRRRIKWQGAGLPPGKASVR